MRYQEHNNCLFWSIGQRLRFGGKLHFRFSDVKVMGIFALPRFLWEKDNKWWYFAPLHPKQGWRAVIDKIWFKGRPRRFR